MYIFLRGIVRVCGKRVFNKKNKILYHNRKNMKTMFLSSVGYQNRTHTNLNPEILDVFNKLSNEKKK